MLWPSCFVSNNVNNPVQLHFPVRSNICIIGNTYLEIKKLITKRSSDNEIVISSRKLKRFKLTIRMCLMRAFTKNVIRCVTEEMKLKFAYDLR